MPLKDKSPQLTHRRALDTFDLCLSLRDNGWSSCNWVINDECHISYISHVIGEPYETFINALTSLIKGEHTVHFQWYNEPGAERVTIRRDGEYLQVERLQTEEENEEEHGGNNEPLSFVTTERTFLTVCYMQLKKTALLMKDPYFSEGRNGKFPFRKFYDFEWQARAYLGY